MCHGPTETLGKAGWVSSSLCKWAGTRSVQELLCAQRSSGAEHVDQINVWESVRREEGCHAGVARGLVHILHFSYQCARKSARMIQKKAKNHGGRNVGMFNLE